MKKFISLTCLHTTRFLITIYFLTWPCTAAAAPQELQRGFKASPDPSVSKFQPLLTDSTQNFSLGFLRVNKDQLALTVLHVPSSQPLWQANPTHLARWVETTELSFNGSLVFSDHKLNLVWSTSTETGDHVVLLNTSNLQVQKNKKVVWQSFDFPTDTLIENQNFTSNMTLVSSNDLYSMRLGKDFIALYAKFKQGIKFNQIYYKRKALQARASIVDSKGPLYMRVESDGYLGMYQTGTTPPVDVEAFNTFQRPINSLVVLRLEPDGNLKGYYWDGSSWALDYQAISTQCELPSACGAYGICNAGKGCSCFDNQTDFHADHCLSSTQSGDFCGGLLSQEKFSVLRRKGVELPYKELMKYETVTSVEQCESLCEKNCMCWGAVYNYASGFCYLVDYPIQTLVGVGDDTKLGYFKIKDDDNKKGKKINVRLGVVIGVLSSVVLAFVGIGIWSCRIWREKKRGSKGCTMDMDSNMSPGPYKNLGSESFGSIEMGGHSRNKL